VQSLEPSPAPKRVDAACIDSQTFALKILFGNLKCLHRVRVGAVKAPLVANEFLEWEVSELIQAVSHAYARGRFKTYIG
jgi:hypothetical protein